MDGRGKRTTRAQAAPGLAARPATLSKVVLVIDDDVAFRRDVCEALETDGYGVMAAADGRDAMKLLTFGGVKPAAILLDLNMPEIDGLSFIRWVEQQPHLKKIPIVVASAFVPARQVELVAARGVLEKPFSVDSLLEVLERVA